MQGDTVLYLSSLNCLNMKICKVDETLRIERADKIF